MSAEGKNKLAPALSPGNLDKTLVAPATGAKAGLAKSTLEAAPAVPIAAIMMAAVAPIRKNDFPGFDIRLPLCWSYDAAWDLPCTENSKVVFSRIRGVVLRSC